MIEPPDPKIYDLILAAAAKLGFRVLTRDAVGKVLGAFSDPDGDVALVLAGGAGPGTCAWALLEGARPKTAFLLTQEAYEALRGGALADDGALVYRGARYRLRATFEGVADLVAEKGA